MGIYKKFEKYIFYEYAVVYVAEENEINNWICYDDRSFNDIGAKYRPKVHHYFCQAVQYQ